VTKTEQYGYLEGGKLHILNRKRMEDDLRQFKDCDVEITIKKRGKRSLPQNAYYWSTVVRELRDFFIDKGNDITDEDIHEMLKKMFNPLHIRNDGGEIIDTIGGTTTTLNKEEFASYLDRIIIWSAIKLQLTIPAPGEQTSIWEAEYDHDVKATIVR
jgi:hypothetical protein